MLMLVQKQMILQTIQILPEQGEIENEPLANLCDRVFR